MERILVVGASLLQLPAILKAKALGYYVGVVDINPEAEIGKNHNELSMNSRCFSSFDIILPYSGFIVNSLLKKFYYFAIIPSILAKGNTLC